MNARLFNSKAVLLNRQPLETTRGRFAEGEIRWPSRSSCSAPGEQPEKRPGRPSYGLPPATFSGPGLCSPGCVTPGEALRGGTQAAPASPVRPEPLYEPSQMNNVGKRRKPSRSLAAVQDAERLRDLALR